VIVRLASLVSALALCLALLPASAAASHIQCGDAITQDTTLDSDLVDCPGDGVIIAASGVTLDLAGHTIDGTRGATQGVQNDGAESVTVTNGHIRDFQDAVRIRLGDSNVLTGLTLSDSGFGVNLEDASATLVESNVIRSSGAGLFLFREANFNTIRGNSISGNGTGVLVSGVLNERPDGTEISGNDISDNSTGVLAANTLRARLTGNRVADNAEDGIAERGFATRIEANHVSGNGANGISVFNSFSAEVVRNRSWRNGLDGVRVGMSAVDVTVSDNFALQNADDGIHTDTSRTSITANKANVNGDLGIEAVPGVTDGGGNKAHGNGNPLQCLNVSCK